MKNVCAVFVLIISCLHSLEPHLAFRPICVEQAPSKSIVAPATSWFVKKKISPYLGVVGICPAVGARMNIWSNRSRCLEGSLTGFMSLCIFGLRGALIVTNCTGNTPQSQYYGGIGLGGYLAQVGFVGGVVPCIPVMVGVQTNGFKSELGMDIVLVAYSGLPVVPLPVLRFGWQF